MSYINVGAWDRVMRVVIGAVLLAVGIYANVPVPWLWDLVGAILFLTGLIGFCLVYRLFGIDTTHRARS
jgi:hypothetical protein